MVNQKVGFGIFSKLILVIGLLLILIVNREFGVADNGDFIRHTGEYVSKPSALTENWPLVNTNEHKLRFFTQPIFYWTAQENIPGQTEFTSANILWAAGTVMGKYFFNRDVVNLKYVGIMFFLIHCAAYSVLVFSTKSRHSIKHISILSLLFFIYTDATISAFYNSFYTDSVPLLSLMIIFAYFMAGVLKENASKQLEKTCNTLGVIAFASIILAIFAKHRYIYFLVPAIITVFFMADAIFNMRKIKAIILFFAVMALPVYFAMNHRIENQTQVGTAKVNSFHALYDGILPLSNKKNELLDSINMPQDSLKYLGQDAFNKNSQEFISSTSNLTLKAVIKVIYHDPLAFCKLILLNAQEVGNFNIYLGMVPATYYQHPPTLITGITSLATQLSGVFFCAVVLVSACLLCFFRFHLDTEACHFNRVLALVLSSVFLLDIITSTFDGNMDARRHLLIASVAGVLIISQLFILWINFVAKQFQDISHQP